MKLSKLKISLVFLFFCLLSISTYAQTSRFSKNAYTNGKGDTLNYQLLYPDYNPSRKYPLVIFLHGSGERGSDNEAQLKWGVQAFATDEMMSMHPCLVIAPQCPANQGWANFKDGEEGSREMHIDAQPSMPMQLLYELIQKTIKEMPVDTNRIYITGLSMGGFGTYDAIARYPKLFAAAIPVCGGGDTSKAPVFAKIPIWILHGSEDTAVDPQYSLDMEQALIKAGAHPGFTMYPEVGHFSWLMAYNDKLVLEWLFRQGK